MVTESKERFFLAVLRMKKIAACFPKTSDMQTSELAVMYKASEGCSRDESGFMVSDIQKSLHISKPAVSQVLNGLEKKGYIVRSIDSGDRRKIIVTLTQDGEGALQDAVRCHNEVVNQVFSQFGEDNARLFIQLVNRLMDTLEEISAQEQNERCN